MSENVVRPSSALRSYQRANAVVFLKTKERFGGLSNMAGGFRLRVNGIDILTSEALYQACRFPHRPEIQRLIIDQPSPMTAKMKSKPYRSDSRPDWDAVRAKIMRWCLRVKLAQNWASFGELLLSTGDRPIVEESRKDEFWGAIPEAGDTLVGANVLGRLLMELREELRLAPENLREVAPPDIPNFLLDGKKIAKVIAAASEARSARGDLPLFAAPRLDAALEKPLASTPTEHSERSDVPLMNSQNQPPTKVRKKLIEVALPLEAINAASAREKSIRHGHPSTLHLWWARRPLAAARAVIFAQMVDDPSSYPDLFPTEKKQEKERERLFRIIEDLVKWENTTNETVLQKARDEIWTSWRRSCAENADHPGAKDLFDRNNLPAFHDPFAGGGALPLEAQRLGLKSHASDLNPVAVLINKAMIEIPPKFANMPPVNPKRDSHVHWKGSQGLASDVRYYSQGLRSLAEKQIGYLYPKLEITPNTISDRPDLASYIGEKLTVIAWIWARTVKSPNPAYANVHVPLASTFILSTKAGKVAYVQPVVADASYRFTVKVGIPKNPDAAKTGTKLARANFKCLMSGTPISGDYIKAEGRAGRIGSRLMAIVAEGDHGRVYLSPTDEHERIAGSAMPTWRPEGEIASRMTGGNCTPYGLTSWDSLFTNRQLVALTTFSDLVTEVRKQIREDAIRAGLADDTKTLQENGTGATAYSEGVATYLALAISRLADRNNALCTWDSGPIGTKASTGGSARTASLRNLFARQAVPMAWDFGEANPFSESGGGYNSTLNWIEPAIRCLTASLQGHAQAANASTQTLSNGKVVSTDPPYYDNIGYADLSDFFYVWLRRSLRTVYAELFATLAVPKAEELVATAYRHGGRENAEQFFLQGMTYAMHRLADQAHPAFPVTIYYAFKQSETESVEGTSSTGWETFLDAVIRAGFGISGTWPMRTELSNRMIGSGANALASSIVLVCRPRSPEAPSATRREFVAALKAELPAALRHLQAGNIAPVDLAQAAIGPGMGVYTRYSQVLDAEGKSLSVRDALALVNATLDEALAEQEGDFDSDSRWALAWCEQYGFSEGEYGVAETLSKAKNTSVAGLVEAGILESKRGKVRLLRPEELPGDWTPVTDTRISNWESVHHLIRVLASGGEAAAAALAAQLGAQAEPARELAYRLYVISERKKRASEALAYNGLVLSWPEIMRLAKENASAAKPAQGQLI